MVESIDDYEKYMSISRLAEFNLHAHVDTDDNFYPVLEYVLSSNFGGITSRSSLEICSKLTRFRVTGRELQSGLYVRKGFLFKNEFNYA